ncbi:MAG: hypothetical protein L0Z50_22765 [Verrucomicrobiales bacterium]|nr:hypothetical protein [Verrucomicrobiales bacterium]
MPATVVSVRLDPEDVNKLKQLARRAGRTPSEVGADLLSESIRRSDFAFIEFRDSAAGRQAYIQGTRLWVWQAITVLRAHGGDAAKAAAHLRWPEAKMHAAVAYAKAFPSEIEEAIKESEAVDFEKLSRLLPGIQRFEDVPLKGPLKGRK